MPNETKFRNVAVGVVFVMFLLGTLTMCVPRVRENAARATSSNNIKQIALSLHNYESSYLKLPPLFGGGSHTGSATENFTIAGGSTGQATVLGPIHLFLIPYVESSTLYREMTVKRGDVQFVDPYGVHDGSEGYKHIMRPYCSPSDPSHTGGRDAQGRAITSYAANAQLFARTNRNGLIEGELTGNSAQYDRGLSLKGIKDGSENVIAFAEKFGQCGNGGSLWSANIDGSGPPVKSAPGNTNDDPYLWPVFALGGDKGPPSAKYAIDPKQGESLVFFQIQPKWQTPDGCDAFRSSTPYGSGTLVGMADGSVRTISRSVSPEIWFQALHLEDGAVFSLD